LHCLPILLFHRESKRESVLAEAMSRLMQLVNTHFKAIAKELKGEDPYQYLKAYSAGKLHYRQIYAIPHVNRHLSATLYSQETLFFSFWYLFLLEAE
jgi:hypothetical protein